MEVVQTIQNQVKDEYLREKFAKSVAAAERTIDLYGCGRTPRSPAMSHLSVLSSPDADPAAQPAASTASRSRSTAARTRRSFCTCCARLSRGIA